jgi:hypothetical protein
MVVDSLPRKISAFRITTAFLTRPYAIFLAPTGNVPR